MKLRPYSLGPTWEFSVSDSLFSVYLVHAFSSSDYYMAKNGRMIND